MTELFVESFASLGRFWFFENGGFGIGGAISACCFAAQNFCQAPIHHEDFAEWADHDVGGFQVAMKNPARVGERYGFANAQEEPQAVLHGRDVFDEFVQTPPFDKFHGVKDAAVGERADVVNGDDSGMFEAREDARFAHEAIRQIAVRARNVEDFQGNAAFEFFVFGRVDDAHASASDAFEQAVTRAREVRFVGAGAEALDGFVGERFHFASQPKTARASR